MYQENNISGPTMPIKLKEKKIFFFLFIFIAQQSLSFLQVYNTPHLFILSLKKD